MTLKRLEAEMDYPEYIMWIKHLKLEAEELSGGKTETPPPAGNKPWEKNLATMKYLSALSKFW